MADEKDRDLRVSLKPLSGVEALWALLPIEEPEPLKDQGDPLA